MTQQSNLRILRRVRLEKKIDLSRSAIYERLDPKSRYYDPDFPKPIKLGNGANPPVGWLEHEVDAWLNAQIAKSRKSFLDSEVA